MDGKYNLHSPFDIEKHKQAFTNYLEVVIDEYGTVMYAVPSHKDKATALACAKLNVTRNELDAMCPPEYWCDYATWLCITGKLVMVWNDFCIAPEPNTKQIGALRRLKMAGLYRGTIPHCE